MKSVRSLLLLALPSLAVAINYSYGNLPPELAAVGNPPQTLDVAFPLSSWDCGKKSYVTVKPGRRLTSTDTQNSPVPYVGSIYPQSSSGKYVFIMVDPETNTTDHTYPALHTLYANVSAIDNGGDWTVLAPYIHPEPTPGAAHNYTFILFEQPEAQFEVPSKYQSFLPLNLSDVYSRIGFPLLDFIHDADLGEPLAGNWFRESAVTNSTSSSIIPSRSVGVCSATPSSPATGTVSIPWTPTGRSNSTGTGTSKPTSPVYSSMAMANSPRVSVATLGLSIVIGVLSLL